MAQHTTQVHHAGMGQEPKSDWDTTKTMLMWDRNQNQTGTPQRPCWGGTGTKIRLGHHKNHAGMGQEPKSNWDTTQTMLVWDRNQNQTGTPHRPCWSKVISKDVDTSTAVDTPKLGSCYLQADIVTVNILQPQVM